MDVSGLFRIGGGGWASALRGAYQSVRRAFSSKAPDSTALVPQVSAPVVDGLVMSLRDAGRALSTAFSGFATRTRPVYATNLYTTGISSSATLSGLSARITDLPGYSSLQTTQSVNTQASTVRSSSAALGLDITSAQSASTKASTAEMNTGFDTSYGSSSLVFTGPGAPSTSAGTLTGTYTGTGTAANATSLTVRIGNNSAIVGLTPSNVQFEVVDQNNTVLFTHNGDITAGQQVYLGDDIGLSVSFSAGTLRNNHAASTTVTRTPITVNGDAAFNAGAGQAPRFEGGAVVTAGSFTVNGTSITVNANDTINTVISRINSSGAGVTASLANDKITLTTNGYSEDAITLANDTSGFLAATKLSGAATATGNIRDDQQVFSKTSQFSTVADGSFTINGVSISVDADQDSLQTVISRINGAGAGVSAAYDAATDRMVVTPTVAGSTLTIGSDTSGFLTAASIATGTTATVANPDAAFNATGASGPLFDPGMAVVAGSFTVNGVSISVAANDTINTVLAKITASAAGVDATYDSATETVRLVTRASTETPITVANDTSGFLAAVKLNGTAQSSTGGATSPFDAVLTRMTEYAGVQAGTLTVNGQQIAINPATTTINGLLSALNGLTNVSASLDEGTGRISIHSSLGGSITISDTSGLLTTLGFTAGTYTGVAGTTTSIRTQTGTEPSNTADVVEHLSAAVGGLNTALSQLIAGRERDSAMGADLASALEEAVAALQRLGVRGVSVTKGSPALSLDSDALTSSLNSLANPREARTTIGGVVDTLTTKMAERAERQVQEAAPPASFTLELPAMPVLDRAAAQARIAAARKAARTSAYTKPLMPKEDRLGTVSNQSPFVAKPVSGEMTPYVKPGLFEGLFEEMLKYF